MVAKYNLEKGHILTKEDFIYKRPNEAMFFIGKKFTKDVKIDKTIFESDFL